MHIQIINGPNLNLLGTRETDIYGSRSFEDFLPDLQARFPNDQITYYQSNIEGELINALQQSTADGILLNAGGYTHTSVALADTISAIKVPVIEVHISNIYQREQVRHHSLIAAACKGSISSLGLDSYTLGVHAIHLLLNK